MIFRRAIIRLTLTYLVVQLLLFGAFAAAVYLFVVGTFDFDSAQARGSGGVDGAEQGFAALRRVLLIGYCALLLVVPVASYLMARTALGPLRRSYALQQQFVDGASHEMRTPLSIIQGELELALSRPRRPEQYQRAISSSLQATENLIQLTNELLILSRDNVDELRWSFADTDVNGIITELAAAVTEAPAEHPRLVLKLDPLAHVRGSRELLFRAIGNLLDNAVKFTPPDGDITMETRTVGAHCVISVQDTGPGMDAADAARAFDRFWRSDEARSKPGHGLGLPLVRAIAAAHHGNVVLSSQPGSGTTVTLTLPL